MKGINLARAAFISIAGTRSLAVLFSVSISGTIQVARHLVVNAADVIPIRIRRENSRRFRRLALRDALEAISGIINGDSKSLASHVASNPCPRGL